MNQGEIGIYVNERPMSVEQGATVGELRDRVKPGADVLVVNGFPSESETVIRERDKVVLIKRGERPSRRELEILMAARHTPGVHERMREARVGVAGLGGLGSSVVIALARMGVGELVVADFDVVEPSNLNRQQYTVDDIGMPKTEAMSRQVAVINPCVRLEAHRVVLEPGNIPEVFSGVEVLVECLDRAEAKAMFIRAASQGLPGTFLVGASGVAGYGDGNSIRTVRLGDQVFMTGDMVSAAQPGRGLMAPRVGIAAHHQADMVVSLLMEGQETRP